MSRPSRGGLTRIEVLVVIGVIAVLIGFMLPAVRRVREPAARMQCSNNLKQMMIGLHTLEETGRPASYPPTGNPDAPAERSFPAGCFGPGATPEERLSWMVALLPYVEQQNVYARFDLGKGYAGNLPAAGTRVRTFLCPSAEKEDFADELTHYVAMAGVGADAAGRPAGAAGIGFMGYDRSTSLAAIKDGTSNTIALIETRSGLGPWARGGSSTLRGFDPADLPICGDGRPFGGHAGGMNAAMADGSVRFIHSTVEPRRLAAAVTIAGGESVGLD